MKCPYTNLDNVLEQEPKHQCPVNECEYMLHQKLWSLQHVAESLYLLLPVHYSGNAYLCGLLCTEFYMLLQCVDSDEHLDDIFCKVCC